jgi:hypothetical protein
MVRPFAFAVLSFPLCISSASAKTWIVDSTGAGDFKTIQEAVDAATDGDVVEVVPSASYAAFDLSKRLTVRAQSGSVTLYTTGNLKWSWFDTLAVHDVAAGLGAACIDGFTVAGDYDGAVIVSNCGADVVMTNLTIELDPFDVGSSLSIDHSSSVSMSSVSSQKPSPYWDAATYAQITDSNVRMYDCTLYGVDGSTPWPPDWYGYGSAGKVALHCERSYVVFSKSTLTGGKGTDAAWDGTIRYFNGWPGGDAVTAVDSTLVLVSDDTTSITGGEGGLGGTWGSGFSRKYTYGGDGGDALDVTNTSVTTSRANLTGGKGGKGGISKYDGKDGLSCRGATPNAIDAIPCFEVPELVIGTTVTLTLDGTVAGSGILLVSDSGGFEPEPKIVGPQLSVLVSPLYIVTGIGRTDSNGDVLDDAIVPDDSSLVGLAVSLQVALVSDAGPVYLSNAVSRVVTD